MNVRKKNYFKCLTKLKDKIKKKKKSNLFLLNYMDWIQSFKLQD